MQEHQKRVVAERDDLNKKIKNLSIFMHGTIYTDLAISEQSRLVRQLRIMREYVAVLDERIEAFSR